MDFLYPEKKGKKKSPKKAYEILEEMKGADLKGLRCEAPPPPRSGQLLLPQLAIQQARPFVIVP